MRNQLALAILFVRSQYPLPHQQLNLTADEEYGIEFDPLYCDVILKRLARITKASPTLLETGRTFAEMADLRAAEAADSKGDAS